MSLAIQADGQHVHDRPDDEDQDHLRDDQHDGDDDETDGVDDDDDGDAAEDVVWVCVDRVHAEQLKKTEQFKNFFKSFLIYVFICFKLICF